MQIRFYTKGSLGHNQINAGLSFIRRRFLQVWGIYRFDVDYNKILNRDNVVLSSGGDTKGWLGCEGNGELTNACIEDGLYGISELVSLIKTVYSYTSADYYYAETPLSKTGSARAFLMSGMKISNPPVIHRLDYPEKSITLLRLEVFRSKNPHFKSLPPGVDENLKVIKGIRNNVYR